MLEPSVVKDQQRKVTNLSVSIWCGRSMLEEELSLVREDRERQTSGVPVILPRVMAG